MKSLGDQADTYIVKTFKTDGGPAGDGKKTEEPKKEKKSE